jgi:hypothetical protein
LAAITERDATMAFDLVKATKQYKGDLHQFYLSMKTWKKFKTNVKLQWHRAEFKRDNHSDIPRERGIYVFLIEQHALKLPPHGYILYVGITGDAESESDLHRRFGEYLRHQEHGTGRPAVVYMLENWAGHLSFYFCPIRNRRTSLSRIERSFINAVMPPVNKRDMEAEITAVRAAAF